MSDLPGEIITIPHIDNFIQLLGFTLHSLVEKLYRDDQLNAVTPPTDRDELYETDDLSFIETRVLDADGNRRKVFSVPSLKVSAIWSHDDQSWVTCLPDQTVKGVNTQSIPAPSFTRMFEEEGSTLPEGMKWFESHDFTFDTELPPTGTRFRMRITLDQARSDPFNIESKPPKMVAYKIIYQYPTSATSIGAETYEIQLRISENPHSVVARSIDTSARVLRSH